MSARSRAGSPAPRSEARYCIKSRGGRRARHAYATSSARRRGQYWAHPAGPTANNWNPQQPDRRVRRGLVTCPGSGGACWFTLDPLSDAGSWNADVVLVAVPPKVTRKTVRALTPHLRAGQIVVSFAAGVPLARLEGVVPWGVSVIRVMPSAPSLAGQGLNPAAFCPTVTQKREAPSRQSWAR